MTTTSKLTLQQVKTFGPKPITGFGPGGQLTVKVRFDDECKNGHNTFAITADVTSIRSRAQHDIEAGGCLHELIIEHFPQLKQLIQWHGCSTDSPLHYIENTMYWLGRRGNTSWHNGRTGRDPQPHDPPNFDFAKKSAIWPDMPESYIFTGTTVSNDEVEAALTARLPALLIEFQKAVEALEMVW
jgi:hypothetical protein